ncbi:MAG: hypothetical protein HRU29_11900 [Rhizobiales bacterium]|nr:hypothetical protein [Hyphomicrobiales bacterium]NRB15092.1 hypothetical protein [Hyphomicrobiales bacterium]
MGSVAKYMGIVLKVYLWGSGVIVAAVLIVIIILVIIIPAPLKPIILKIEDIKKSSYVNRQNSDCEAVFDDLAAKIIEISHQLPKLPKKKSGLGYKLEYVERTLPKSIPPACVVDLHEYFVETTHTNKNTTGAGLYFNLGPHTFSFFIKSDGTFKLVSVVPTRPGFLQF